MVFRCTNPDSTTYANRIDREMNRLFASFFGENPAAGSPRTRTTAANVWEADDAWMVEMELPGVDAVHLDISVLNDELTVTAERPSADEKGVTYYRRERPAGKVSRALRLPAAVDAERVAATLVRGVLTITLPKAEAARRRKIDVQTSN